MPETDAQTLDNMVCEPGYVRSRYGATKFCDLGGGLNEGAFTLASVKLVTGSEAFLAIVSARFSEITTGTEVDRSTTYDATAAMTNSLWNTCVYRNRIFGCNGVDRPFVWTGSGDVQLAGWTGPSDVKKLLTVQPYRSRLYFTESGSASYWYTTAVNNITGALIEKPLGSVLHFGGYPIFVGSSTNRQGDTSQELFVVYSSEGEVLIYSGRYPDDASWTLIKRSKIAPPLDVRCYVYTNTDLYLITRVGPISVDELLSSAIDNPLQLESSKVRQYFIDAAAAFVAGQPAVCHATYCPNKNYTMFNLRSTNADATDTTQLVINNATKAWSRWGGIPMNCSATFGGELYTSGLGADVYLMDVKYGTSYIAAYLIKQAYSFLDNPKANKKVTMMQPLITFQKTSGSEATDSLTYGADADLESPAALNTMSFQVTSSTAKLNKPVMPLTAYGKALALRFEDTPSVSYDARFYGSWLQVEDAGGLT